MASIHYLKCSFYLHWERTQPHHIQDSIQKKINEAVLSSETIFKQQSGLRWALGWWEERQDLGQSLWRDGIPRFHPGVLNSLKSHHSACYSLGCIRAEATRLRRKEGEVTKPSQSEPHEMIQHHCQQPALLLVFLRDLTRSKPLCNSNSLS